MTDAHLLRMIRSAPVFVGLQNFARLFRDPVFIEGLWRTLRWDVAVVGAELLIALPIALFLNLSFKGRGFVRAAVLIPYVIPPAVTALMWVYMFDANFGIVNDVLIRLGLLDHGFAFLSDPNASFMMTAFAMTWAGQPLLAIIILATLQTVPSELYEAARVDGAGPFRQFWHVTLPHIAPTLIFLGLIRTIWMSNHIDMIYIMTRGGPGFSNYTEAVYSFTLTGQLEIGYSSAVAVALAIILLSGAVFYIRYLARSVLSQ
jgi:multiple sugar transport system permease protein